MNGTSVLLSLLLDDSMLSVSVAMATFNGEQRLRRQLDSLAAQNHPPNELVVVDDASDDNTLSIVTDFAKKSRFPVRVHRNESRIGYRENFMRAANLCTSDVIAFCDQDDNWYPHKIKTCIERLGKPDILLVCHNADVATSEGRLIGRLSKSVAGPPFSTDPMLYPLGFTQVFRRLTLQASSLWTMSVDHFDASQPMAHDQWIFFLASALGKIHYLNTPLVAYIQHGNNTYGWPGNAHPRRKIRSVLANHGEQYSKLSVLLERRSIILDSARVCFDGIWKERARVAANNYRRLSEVYAKRSSIYLSTKFTDRLMTFRDLLVKGGYRGKWSLGPKSLVKDFCLGVPIGPFMRSI